MYVSFYFSHFSSLLMFKLSVGVWFGGGGNTVSEPHTHSLTPLQEGHQRGRRERGTNVSMKYLRETHVKKNFSCYIIFTPRSLNFKHSMKNWQTLHCILHSAMYVWQELLLSRTKRDWFSPQKNKTSTNAQMQLVHGEIGLNNKKQ